MSGIALETAEKQLTSYIAAEEKILLGQAVERNGKRLTMADLESVQAGIAIWGGRVERLSGTGGISTVEVIPR
jgi:hypothetical protein